MSNHTIEMLQKFVSIEARLFKSQLETFNYLERKFENIDRQFADIKVQINFVKDTQISIIDKLDLPEGTEEDEDTEEKFDEIMKDFTLLR